MERSWDDAIRRNGEESGMIRMEGMLVAWLTIARRLREAIEVDDADGTGMLSSRRFETEHCVDEAPVAVEEGVACVDEMLQNGEDAS